jgi:hypothetical protein
MISTLIASALLAPAEPIELYRTFEKGKTYNYSVRTHLQSESREVGQNTFIPEDVDINYDFNYKILDVQSSGIAKVLYQRPVISQIDGETANRGPVTTKLPLDWKMELDLSPINAVTGVKDLSKGDNTNYQWLKPAVPMRSFSSMSPMERQDIVSQFVSELQRLVLFIGGLDSSLDFSPRLPLGEVEVGEKWRQTMSYQPMEIKGSGGQFEVQRLDMDLVFNGMKEKNGVKYASISGLLKLDTDAAKYINQAMRMTANQSGLSKLPMKLETKIEFELDPKTYTTRRATSSSVGNWSIFISGFNDAYQEENINGKASIVLNSIK